MWCKVALSAILTLVTLTPAWAGQRNYRPPPRNHYEDRGEYRDGRTVWRHRTGAYEWQGGKRWLEIREDGRPIPFRETRRTPDFVELYDHSRGLYLRLYQGRALQLGEDDYDWGEGARGYWD